MRFILVLAAVFLVMLFVGLGTGVGSAENYGHMLIGTVMAAVVSVLWAALRPQRRRGRHR